MEPADEIISDIYEAAVVPDCWPALLGKMSERVDGAGALLFTVSGGIAKGIASPDLQAPFDEFNRDGWASINKRPERLIAVNYTGFLRDTDLFTIEELDNDPVYRDFYRHRGLGWAAGAKVLVPNGDLILFSFERAYAKGPVPDDVVRFLDTLRPALSRSSLLATRLGLERARAQAATLQALGLPGAVLRGRGTLLAANKLFESFIPSLVQDRRDRLHLADGAADGLLGDALQSLSQSRFDAAVASIPVAATGERLPLILHLVPVLGAANDVFSPASALLVVTPVDRGVVPTAEVLQGLFDLTPAEARVAQGIAAAQTIDAVAETSGVSRETVRTQLKAVLAKTGVARQTELVNLLAGKAMPVAGLDH